MANTKKPFSKVVEKVSDEVLKQPVCVNVHGDLYIQQEAESIISLCAATESLGIKDFGDGLGLTEEEVSAAIGNAPSEKEQQMRQAVLAWSKGKGGEATYEKLLEALYIKDEVELVEDICQRLSLSQTKISDKRHINPIGADVSTLPTAIYPQSAPYKATRGEEGELSPSVEQEPLFQKPVRASSSEISQPACENVIQPVDATEQGQSHAELQLSKSSAIPGYLHDKEFQRKVPSSDRAESGPYQVENGSLSNSTTLQSEPSSYYQILAARIKKNEKREEELDARVRELERGNRDVEKLRDEITSLGQKVEELELNIQEKETQIQDLQQKLDETVAESQKREKILASEVEKRESAEEQRDIEKQRRQKAERTLQKERDSFQEKEKTLRKEAEDLRKQLVEAETAKQQLEQELKQRDSKNSKSVREQVDGEANGSGHVRVASRATNLRPFKYLTIVDLDLENPLGSGSYGDVYDAKVDGDNTRYAAKRFKAHVQGQSFNEKWLQEFTTIRQLAHGNIVRYIGCALYQNDTIPTFIMEKMDSSLSARLRCKSDVLSPSIKIRILHDVANGLDYLHTSSVIHRDLTANNVLLIGPDGYLVAKIADFGNAKIITSEERNNLTPNPGTRAYSAPEVDCGGYDEKCDIFSFGHLTLCTLSGRLDEKLQGADRKNEGTSCMDYIEVKRRSVYFDHLSGKDTALLERLMIKKCLNVRPSERPHAHELRDILSRECGSNELRIADPNNVVQQPHQSVPSDAVATSSDDDIL